MSEVDTKPMNTSVEDTFKSLLKKRGRHKVAKMIDILDRLEHTGYVPSGDRRYVEETFSYREKRFVAHVLRNNPPIDTASYALDTFESYTK